MNNIKKLYKLFTKYLVLFFNFILKLFGHKLPKPEHECHKCNLKTVHKDEDGYYEVHHSNNPPGYLISHNRILVHIAPTMEEAKKWMENN